MCHLILLMPVLALPIFWLMPLSFAIPIYMLIVLISGLLYWLIAKAMGKQPETGAESLIGAKAEVVSRLRPGDHAQYLVRSQGELWSGYSTDTLDIGEWVNIVALKGIGVVVERVENGPSHVETKLVGAQDNRRHCH